MKEPVEVTQCAECDFLAVSQTGLEIHRAETGHKGAGAGKKLLSFFNELRHGFSAFRQGLNEKMRCSRCGSEKPSSSGWSALFGIETSGIGIRPSPKWYKCNNWDCRIARPLSEPDPQLIYCRDCVGIFPSGGTAPSQALCDNCGKPLSPIREDSGSGAGGGP